MGRRYVTESQGDRPRSQELAAIYVVSGITLSGVQLILPALPQIRDALGFTEAQMGFVTLVYLSASFVFGIPAECWSMRSDAAA